MKTIFEDDASISDAVKRSIKEYSNSGQNDGIDESFNDYRKYIFRKWLFISVCIAVAVSVMGIALTVGSYDIGFWEAYEILFNNLLGNVTDPVKDSIVINLRMPRIIVGLIAGVGLATCGVVMQSTMRNPLADPYTTGVSSGALFGATLAMTAGISLAAGHYAIVANAFVFSLIPMFVIVFVSKIKNTSPTVMIMAGIAVMYVFNASTTVMMLWANPNDLMNVYQWQVGSLTQAGWEAVPIMLVITVVGVVIMQFLSRKMNALSSGDENAKSMGIDVDNMRIICLMVVAMVCATIVSFTGLIGFIGLVAPHVVRIFIGSDNRYLIPASAAFGAALLISADLLGRVVIAPAVLQVGVVTAFLGGPMFLWLILRKKSEVWG
jgi:ABC-type Fe3+-siderophore transport system, permease component